MRKIIILTVVLGLLVLAQSQGAATLNCTATQYENGDKCSECSDDKNGGIAGCNSCHVVEKSLVCKSCSAGKFLKADGKLCEDCTANCHECTGPNPATENGDRLCKTCAQGFFLDQQAEPAKSNFCSACGANCFSCSSAKVCLVCHTNLLLNRPNDDGKCVSVADCTTAKGVSGLNPLNTSAPVCSSLQTPLVNDKLNATYNVSNSISLDALCAPASAETAEGENVGAVVVNTAGETGQTTLDVIAIRNAIQTALGVKAEDFAKENRQGVVNRVRWLNIIGSKAGTAPLKDFLVARGKSVLEYVCVNSWNVVSAVKTIKLNSNVTVNNNVRFSVSFKRVLNDTELLNLTCAVANALFPNDTVGQATVKNNKGAACGAKASRILQTASTINDYYFDVAADQFADNFESTIRGKASAVKTAVTSFSTSVNASIAIDVADSAVSQTAVVAPVITLNATNINSTSFTLNVTSTQNAQVRVVVVNSSFVPGDDVLRGSSTNGTLYKETFDVNVNQTVQKVVSKDLAANTAYKVHYYGVNKLDSTKVSKTESITVNTAANSFSSLIGFGSLILLVLALFI